MLTPWDKQVGENLSACHRCPRRQVSCAGPCACLEDGRDILAHAEEGDCPLGEHVKPPSRGLGDTVARVAKAIGAEKLAQVWEHVTGRDCGCQNRREKLNEKFPYTGGDKVKE